MEALEAGLRLLHKAGKRLSAGMLSTVDEIVSRLEALSWETLGEAPASLSAAVASGSESAIAAAAEAIDVLRRLCAALKMLPQDADWQAGFTKAAKEEDGLQGIIHYISLRPIEYSGTIIATLEKSWGRDYRDPAKVLDYVCDTLDDFSRQWLQTTYLAAWTAVIQSSGWGKSRTFCELWRKGVYMVYISFMPGARRGFPPGNPAAGTLTYMAGTGAGAQPRLVAAWVLALLQVLAEFIKKNSRAIKEQAQLEMKDQICLMAQAWNRVQTDNAEEIAAQVKSKFEGNARSFLNLMVGEKFVAGKAWVDSPLQTKFWKEIQELVLDDHELQQMLRPTAKLRILFCLDEAGSHFQSNEGSFLATRRVFSIINRGSGIFGVVMDTTAKLGMLAQQKMYDPSAKGTADETRVFKPINLVGVCSSDIRSLLESLGSQVTTKPSLKVTIELFKLGRPLWSACFPENQRITEGYTAEVVNFACQKLLGGLPPGSLNGHVTEAMSMALVGVAAGLDVAPWSNLAMDMVAAHMRTATHISDERDLIFSADAMEPILGEAAAGILAENKTLIKALEIAEKVCKQALVVEGPRGELIGRLLLVLAMHQCCRESSEGIAYNMYSHPVKLGAFLTKLCGQDIQAEGLIAFNRFVVINREITQADLLLSFICNFAILAQRNQEAFDALLAYLVPGPDGKYELREDRMRGIPVQIRNRDTYSVNTRRLSQFANYFTSFKEEVIANYLPAFDAMEEAGQALESMEESKETEEDEPHLMADDGDDEEPMEVDYPISSGEKYVATELLGLYLHLPGQRKQKAYFEKKENGKVYVLHGMRPYAFLQPDVLRRLERLRVAYHKLPQMGREGDILRQMIPTYFKPPIQYQTERVLQKLTVAELRKLCTERNIQAKAEMIKALLENCGICGLRAHKLRSPTLLAISEI